MTQYIVTDPCYVLPNSTWDKICKDYKTDEEFIKLVTQELNKLAGTTNALAANTGFGDWSNTLSSTNESKIIRHDFFADSGTVCVVEYNNKVRSAIQENKNDYLIDYGGMALIETKGNVKIEMDTSDKNWTVVQIKDEEDTFRSLLPDDENDE